MLQLCPALIAELVATLIWSSAFRTIYCHLNLLDNYYMALLLFYKMNENIMVARRIGAYRIFTRFDSYFPTLVFN